MAAAEPIRDKKELKELADYYLQKGQIRNYVLIIMGAYTALRISDLLQLRWSDVYDNNKDVFFVHITITEKKTGKTKTVALNKKVISALRLYYSRQRGEYIFANNREDARPISRVQAWRIIHTAADAVGMTGSVSCHSLRKTWGYHAWTCQKVSPVVIMDIYNHSNYKITKRYLGIEQDDLDKAYLEMDLI